MKVGFPFYFLSGDEFKYIPDCNIKNTYLERQVLIPIPDWNYLQLTII